MKKFSALFIAILLTLGLGVNIDAKGSLEKTCKTKGYTKKCVYGIPQSHMVKTITYKYNKNWIIKEKTIDRYSLDLTSRVVYKYNKKGQLKTNKYGNASRYTTKYTTKHMDGDYRRLVKETELKKYNAKGASYSKYKKLFNTKERSNKLVQTSYYKYNKKGELKSNKYGSATREVKKYKVQNNKNYNYFIQKGKYNSKGKLKITSTVYK